MIQQGLKIRQEFKQKVKSFCTLVNVEWSDNVYDSQTGGVIGDPDDVEKVIIYISDLERNKKRKKS